MTLFSVSALAAGDINRAKELQNLLFVRNMEIKKAQVEIEGLSAEGQAAASIAAGEQQKKAKDAEAVSSFGSAGTSIGSVTLSELHKQYQTQQPAYRINQQGVQNMGEWQDGVIGAPSSKAVVTIGSKKPELKYEDATKKLDSPDWKEPFSTYRDDVQTVKMKDTGEFLSKFKDRIQDRKKDYQSSVDAINSKVDKMDQKLTTIAQATSNLTTAIQKQLEGVCNARQAQLEALKTLSQYVLDTARATAEIAKSSADLSMQRLSGLEQIENSIRQAGQAA